MKIIKATSHMAGLIALLLMLTTLQLTALAQTTRQRPQVRASEPRYAHEFGYRAGYEDGYEQGKEDFDSNQARDYARSDDYQRADRTYERRMGDLREYQDGYQAGFELGYGDGYFGRPFMRETPGNLGQIVNNSTIANRPRTTDDRGYNDQRNDPRNDPRNDQRNDSRNDSRTTSRNEVFLNDGQQMMIRLTSPINTKTNREGDQFTAVVVDPRDLSEATVVGSIATLKRSGRATGKTEMSLAFDSITLRDGRSGSLAAQVEKVYESENVKTVDEEGNVQTGSRTKDTATRGAGGAAVGAIIGVIAGGGKGAAIGAIIGAGVGAGSVYVQGSKDLILEPGTEMLIRVNAPTRR